MSEDLPKACEVVVTGPTDGTLNEIARQLVEARLIACADVFDAPVTSTCRWEGAIETEQEKRAHLHMRADLVEEVVAFVKERHPYDVPNVAAIPFLAGNADYLAWTVAETRDRWRSSRSIERSSGVLGWTGDRRRVGARSRRTRRS